MLQASFLHVRTLLVSARETLYVIEGTIPSASRAEKKKPTMTAARSHNAANASNPTRALPADVPMADISTAATEDGNKRKRKEKETHILYQTTFRKPTWSYFHLSLVTPGTAALSSAAAAASSQARDIDALTVSALLLQPLTAYLGTTGVAVPVDILHTQGRDAYVRLPRQDARGFRASLSGWIGGYDAGSIPGVQEGGRVNVAWRVVAEEGSLGLLKGSGEELFGESGVAY
jgi:ribonuclease P/MRP protein subunit POP8